MANAAKLGSVMAEGSATLNDTSVNNFTIAGQLTMNGGSIKNLNLTGMAQFNNVKVGDITVAEGGMFASQRNLYLDNGSIVSGNVTFTGGKGIVYVSNGSKVLGNVTGGQIENK